MKNAGSVSATWITKNEADKKGYVKLSTNPLGLYSTWIKRDDLVRLEKDQTGSEMWTRVLPTATQVVNYNTRLLSKGKFKFNRMTSVSKSSLLQWPGQNLYFYSRRSTEGIMGASANKWATNTLGWRSPKYQARAEWLHLIAHQFDHSGDRFSNMIFGTKECNTDMMRAEATVRQLLFSGRTYAVEVTIEVKRDMPRVTMPNHSNSIDRVTWLYPQKGEPEVPRFPHWLACKLEYTITSYRPDPQLVYVNDPHTTTFYPFSRQRPFLFEYQLDYMLLEMYLGTFEIPIETDPNQVFKDILAKNKPAKPNFFEWNVNYDLNDDDGEWAAVGVDDLTRSEADEEYRELDEQELDEEF
ncbi:hypothetical protein FRC08_004411 [Ceratobasidium sp. 394]|nr:hypothetical protein FRC08_004411 [Ceratobasidium sp. 394]